MAVPAVIFRETSQGAKINELRIWDALQNQQVQTEKGAFSALDVSADRRYLAVAEPGKTTIWQLD
jgi:hypothetical protein